jgi:membrane protease YdiL (CAAX protease family)
VFFVAIPEEFFYRGYMQSRLDELWTPKWRVLGADLGPGWLLTCLVFAFGHSVVVFQWWHFAIFFPALIFGWLRARTNGVIAGALFHAACNVTVNILDSLYGVVHP